MADSRKPEDRGEGAQGGKPGGLTKVAAAKGISQSVLKALKDKSPIVPSPRKETSISGATLPQSSTRISRKSDGKKKTRTSIFAKSIVANMSILLDLEEYDFPDIDEKNDPAKIEAKLDVTALDRYNEDIRRLRRMLIEECTAFPQNQGSIKQSSNLVTIYNCRREPDDHALRKIKLTIRTLCRCAFYGTHKALVLAEGAVILISWLLSRKNIKTIIKVHILQSFAEMLWTSVDLKLVLYKCKGVRVLAQLLVNGVKHRSDQCRWACYTLAMSCISSSAVIAAVLEIDRIDEVVGEIAFYSYWINWPANFGSILQGILFGPHSVIPMENTFDFI